MNKKFWSNDNQAKDYYDKSNKYQTRQTFLGCNIRWFNSLTTTIKSKLLTYNIVLDN